MSRKPVLVVLTEQELQLLQSYVAEGSSNRRIAERARIILLCAENRSVAAVAEELGTRPARVSKWRRRFLRYRIFGLSDDQRSGAPPAYDDGVTKRVLDLLELPPPHGRQRWNGELLAEQLGDVSQWQVWRILRRAGIQLQRQHSWTVAARAELQPAAIEIAGLYLSGSTNALILTVGGHEQPPDTPGFVRLTNKRVLTELNRAQGAEHSWSLAAALDAAGTYLTSRQPLRCRRSFLAFAGEVTAEPPMARACAILEGPARSLPEWDRWLKAKPGVQLQFTADRDQWLEQLEFWFCLLGSGDDANRQHQARKLREAAARLLANAELPQAAPFEWHRLPCAGRSKVRPVTSSAMGLVS